MLIIGGGITKCHVDSLSFLFIWANSLNQDTSYVLLVFSYFRRSLAISPRRLETASVGFARPPFSGSIPTVVIDLSTTPLEITIYYEVQIE